MNKTTSPKLKPLTVPVATAQARRIIQRAAPATGPALMIDSKGSWDLETDTHLMVTTLWTVLDNFRPETQAEIKARLSNLDRLVKLEILPHAIIVTRRVK